MSMNDEKMFAALKRGIGGFSARRAAHKEELLARILDEMDTDVANEISDDDLVMLAAAGEVDAMLGDKQKQ